MPLLLSDRRQHAKAAILDFDAGGLDKSGVVSNPDVMKPSDVEIPHFVGVWFPFPASRPTQILTRKCVPSSSAKQQRLVDVALAVADMNAAFGGAEQRHRLAHIFQQRKLSFCSIGTRVGLISGSRQPCPLNFCRFQNLIAASPNGRLSVLTAKLEFISNPHGVCSPAALILAAVDRVCDADWRRVLPLEVNSVVPWRTKTRSFCRGKAVPARAKMAGQDLCLAHPIIREKPIDRFRIRPVLARKRYSRSDRIPHQFHQLTQPPAQSFIDKATARKFSIQPILYPRVHRRHFQRFGAR